MLLGQLPTNVRLIFYVLFYAVCVCYLPAPLANFLAFRPNWQPCAASLARWLSPNDFFALDGYLDDYLLAYVPGSLSTVLFLDGSLDDSLSLKKKNQFVFRNTVPRTSPVVAENRYI
jgi:hypothetical protein